MIIFVLYIFFILFCNIIVVSIVGFVALSCFLFVAKEILMVLLLSTLKLSASWSRHMLYARWTLLHVMCIITYTLWWAS